MLKIILRILISFSFTFALFNSVNAAEVTQLDEGVVAVDSRSTALRSQGIKQAFEDVILKNSGTQSALSNEKIKQQLNSASSLMTQYGYFEQDSQLFLKVNFDHKRIINLLREAGLPVWGKQRPLTLVWLVNEHNGERDILNDASTVEDRNVFNRESAARGVPLLFPLMDLDDAMKVGVNDIRGQFTENVANASLRYQANYFVMATIAPQGSGYQYQMALYPREKDAQALQMTSLVNHSGESASADEAVAAMVGAISQYYVEQYAVADSGERNTTKLTFSEVTDIRQLVAVERYLAQLSAIKHASIGKIQGETVEFNVNLFGDEADLHRLMALDPRIGILNPITESSLDYSSFEPIEASQKETQIYYWKGQ
ncbi:hypothetical protein TUM4438_42630 [Shewanella sairae]|uniref:DUF2066 domain-containing protein n=2 Tax=Shewanella sairae TaxID=190310 RepID=A0ABQ4PQY4_9GAMM|nr:DUF2066 domain-containing protein [Shewanella sairae]MCL1130076.1 DUF2066 domain-containing protein [Shewanella sairae]GIU51788.1 hypothetical protein TUM4438_42630 [Shewanella sairae]